MMRNLIKHLLTAALLLPMAGQAQTTEVYYLSGTDKDHTVDWEFFCSEGANSGKWSRIAVPSCWELQGFGYYNYGWDKSPHREQGLYKHTFQAKEVWRGKRVFLTFEGVMTDATVHVNGQLAGPIHQGAFYRFSYEVSELLRYGEQNLLEVTVDKESSNESVNRAERRADYWIFGGIFRPVYLEVEPQVFIDRVAIDARHDGEFRMLVFPSAPEETNSNSKFINSKFKRLEDGGLSVEMEILNLEGKCIGKGFKAKGIGADGAITLSGRIEHPMQWTSETPNLYRAVFRLKKGKRTVHEYRQRFGFRTMEVRQGDGFYVNGTKIRFKGVCRHTFWPESGRTICPALALEDIRLIKELNMNAVRMSHYPPDTYFLDYCDSLGLYVLDELAGWQSIYDTPTAHRLVGEMVRRDVNHPCIVFWDNGNEGGFNPEVRKDYAMWDPQHRHVLEPWSTLDGVNTKHYPGFERSLEFITKGDNIYMPTESIHGLHDGGHGAGLEDYWETFLKFPLYAGQFLWSFADEGVVRHDLNDSIDVYGTAAPDGIVGPHHEKEGSFYTIKQIWSPVHVRQPLPDEAFDGSLSVENRYHFTDLSLCRFRFGLIGYGDRLDAAVQRADSADLATFPLAPGMSGTLHLPLPDDWRSYDALWLSCFDAEGRLICRWQWPVSTAPQTAARLLSSGKAMTDKERQDLEEKMNSLSPRIVGSPMPKDTRLDWRLERDGTVCINYSFRLDGDYDYAGLALDYPEEGVTGATLMANGPYRVWKNRLKGPGFGVFEKPYNNTVTGETWDYPEFKGYYSEFRAVEVHSSQRPDLTIITPTPDLYLQLYKPQRAKHHSKSSDPVGPDADLAVLHLIPAIGTKFYFPAIEGPQGEKNHCKNQTVSGKVYVRFGSKGA